MSQPAAAPDAKKGKGSLVIIIAAVLVLLGGGGGAFWFFSGSGASSEAKEETKDAKGTDKAEKPEAKKPAKKDKKPDVPPGIVSFDPFIVNLADAGGSRFLRLTMKLVVESEEEAKELTEDEVTRSRVRSAMLELLALQTAETLVTPEGKAELKKLIAESAQHEMEHVEVTDVLFSEFVVQF